MPPQADHLEVPIKRDVFERLQKLAEPLIDDVDSVLRRLIAMAETGQPAAVSRPAYLTLTRGERLPVGLRLHTEFQREVFEATVTALGIDFKGHLYKSPSAAARAVKESVGVPKEASHANGWLFWDYLQESLGAYAQLKSLRRSHSARDEGGGSIATGRPVLRSLGIGASGQRNLSVQIADESPEPPAWR